MTTYEIAGAFTQLALVVVILLAVFGWSRSQRNKK